MLKVTIDTSDFDRVLNELDAKVDEFEMKALKEMGDELLRLSSFEVPHDTGFLQSTGNVERKKDEVIVGYHTDYAARLHEHPEYNFQKGRKGKYLEDPLKKNLSKWLKIYLEEISGTFK